ncbi:hypothetical protein MBOU_09040 [Mycobacterium bourgelatii]|uniref:Uncharacterized protein n=1 Tax=Mycobacterium bourgelatii TaxID=1273442 RepID=A0A7I9YJZ9_MYCBU|nr:hypothetical protein MBOU_09040 [Mycobacterium bourgelatii]
MLQPLAGATDSLAGAVIAIDPIAAAYLEMVLVRSAAMITGLPNLIVDLLVSLLTANPIAALTDAVLSVTFLPAVLFLFVVSPWGPFHCMRSKR